MSNAPTPDPTGQKPSTAQVGVTASSALAPSPVQNITVATPVVPFGVDYKTEINRDAAAQVSRSTAQPHAPNSAVDGKAPAPQGSAGASDAQHEAPKSVSGARDTLGEIWGMIKNVGGTVLDAGANAVKGAVGTVLGSVGDYVVSNVDKWATTAVNWLADSALTVLSDLIGMCKELATREGFKRAIINYANAVLVEGMSSLNFNQGEYMQFAASRSPYLRVQTYSNKVEIIDTNFYSSVAVTYLYCTFLNSGTPTVNYWLNDVPVYRITTTDVAPMSGRYVLSAGAAPYVALYRSGDPGTFIQQARNSIVAFDLENYGRFFKILGGLPDMNFKVSAAPIIAKILLRLSEPIHLPGNDIQIADTTVTVQWGERDFNPAVETFYPLGNTFYPVQSQEILAWAVDFSTYMQMLDGESKWIGGSTMGGYQGVDIDLAIVPITLEFLGKRREMASWTLNFLEYPFTDHTYHTEYSNIIGRPIITSPFGTSRKRANLVHLRGPKLGVLYVLLDAVVANLGNVPLVQIGDNGLINTSLSVNTARNGAVDISQVAGVDIAPSLLAFDLLPTPITTACVVGDMTKWLSMFGAAQDYIDALFAVSVMTNLISVPRYQTGHQINGVYGPGVQNIYQSGDVSPGVETRMNPTAPTSWSAVGALDAGFEFDDPQVQVQCYYVNPLYQVPDSWELSCAAAFSTADPPPPDISTKQSNHLSIPSMASSFLPMIACKFVIPMNPKVKGDNSPGALNTRLFEMARSINEAMVCLLDTYTYSLGQVFPDSSNNGDLYDYNQAKCTEFFKSVTHIANVFMLAEVKVWDQPNFTFYARADNNPYLFLSGSFGSMDAQVLSLPLYMGVCFMPNEYVAYILRDDWARKEKTALAKWTAQGTLTDAVAGGPTFLSILAREDSNATLRQVLRGFDWTASDVDMIQAGDKTGVTDMAGLYYKHIPVSHPVTIYCVTFGVIRSYDFTPAYVPRLMGNYCMSHTPAVIVPRNEQQAVSQGIYLIVIQSEWAPYTLNGKSTTGDIAVIEAGVDANYRPQMMRIIPATRLY